MGVCLSHGLKDPRIWIRGLGVCAKASVVHTISPQSDEPFFLAPDASDLDGSPFDELLLDELLFSLVSEVPLAAALAALVSFSAALR